MYEDKKKNIFQKFFGKYEKKIEKIEKRLTRVMQEEIQKLDVNEEGNFKQTMINLNKLNVIEANFIKEYQKQIEPLIKDFVKSLSSSLKENKIYFKDISKVKYNGEIGETVLKRRLGINDKGGLKKNGYLGRIVRNTAIANDIRTMLEMDIANGRNFGATSEKMSDYLETNKNRRSRIKAYLDTTIRDTYIQNDRAITNEQANKYELFHFIYAGTVVERSRCFCIERVGKAFSIEEAQEWRELIGQECAPIVGIKEEKLQEKKLNYDPLLDMGGWGCLHIPRYITENMYNSMKKE